jgi:glycosyltransferase involved in cell wall biosynthesis
MTMRPAIIIPVYNHEHMIGEVIGQTLQLGLPVLVVDDGSTDSTAAILDAIAGITILRHPENRGKGAAIRTGFAAAVARDCDWALTLDGDGQHNPEDVWPLLEAVKVGPRRVILGRRQDMDTQPHVPWTSSFGRKFSNFWVWVAGGPRVKDSQSGFRLYPLPEALQLSVQARRYQFEVEILVKAQRQGIPTTEVPVRVIYQKRGNRVSHFRPWRDFLRNSATFNRLIWERLLSLLRP